MKVDLVIDIETVTNPVTQADIDRHMSEYVPPKLWKDPEKLAEHKLRAESEAITKIHDDWKFSIGGKRMVCCAIGEARPDLDTVENIESWASDDLSVICRGIKDYLDNFSGYRLVGWNHIRFDLPEIVKSFRLTKTPPPLNRAAKWDLVDLCNHPFKGVKLKDAARALGLKVLDINGSDVGQLYSTGDWETIRAYNEHDVLLTGQVYNATAGWFTF